MGGNALKGFGNCVRRVNSQEFSQFSSEFMGILQTIAPESRFAIVPSYKNKKTHGDIDILVEKGSGVSGHLLKSLREFGVPVVKNGPVLSLAYKNTIQVDLIEVPVDEFDFALNYFSFNDLGNLCGRVFHKAGFKFGHSGLFYILRDEYGPSQVYEEILVTRNYNDALDMMGYPPIDDYEFVELADVFNFALLSPAAHKDIFLLENRNHTSRTRDRKRKTYMEFLKYLSEIPDKEVGEEFKYLTDKNKMRIIAQERFPDFNVRLKEARANITTKKLFHIKFNGVIVSSFTGLKGKDLGLAMQKMKCSKPDFQSFILSSTREEIEEFIRGFHI